MENLDQDCKQLVKILNELSDVETFESCCGHLKEPYRIWFRCYDFSRLAKLYRCVNKNYSDGKWRIEVCGTDGYPLHGFVLESKVVFATHDEMTQSVQRLIDNIKYWEQDTFNEYFNVDNYERTKI